MNGISKLLSTDGFIQVNKSLIKKLGLHEAIIIGELCAEYNYWEEQGKLVDDMFYSTRDNIEENTGLNDHFQRKAIATLKENGIITVDKKDVPAKNYYKIHFDKLLILLSSSSSRDEELEVNDMHLNNNKQTNITKKENNNSKELLLQNSPSFEFGKEKSTPKKESLYSKCTAMINDFTKDKQVISDLTIYLHILLEMRKDGYSLYTNVWKGLLRKLKELSDDPKEQHLIISQSVERGYKSFYPVNNWKSKDYDVTKGKSWEENVSCRQATPEELAEIERLNKEREAKGLRTKF